MLVLVLEECSLEVPLGELSFELEDDDECSVVVGGETGAGATTTAAGGAITTGAGYTVTTAGAGAAVVVSLVLFELVVSVVAANPMAALPNSAAIPKHTAAVVDECFTMMSPLVREIRGQLHS